ncbi:hypothetical protein Pint_02554 [Pistacia integerrima]|uniref:Uncharacterized protein n=1 Tax=Pistacia integerrima TaxID=434235 RepID=A0ACC0ZFD6_9ROSI|nr:hypothetical protein Pint_02554 [Pistacia integerrima]
MMSRLCNLAVFVSESNHSQDQIMRGSTLNNGGWIARVAALLVGEDPTQSYALICANCHMHNGLTRKEDFPYITYYCPHCHALNRPKESKEFVSSSPNTSTLTTDSIISASRSVRESEEVAKGRIHSGFPSWVFDIGF